MSKIVLFYTGENQCQATVVSGHAFVFVANAMSNFTVDQMREFIDEGTKNNGYYWNSVRGEYEFWEAGKSNPSYSFQSVNEIFNKASEYDGTFEVDENKILVQVK